MKSVLTSLLCLTAVCLSVVVDGQQEGAAGAKDPRVGLKPGLHDAGHAARNIELVASLPKPPGFFDPRAPAGEPTPPERERTASGQTASVQAEGSTPAADAKDAPAAEPPQSADTASAGGNGGRRGSRGASALNFANSDLAFKGEYLFLGNFNGFNTYDVEDPKRARLIGSVVCPGGQGDVSVHGNLLFMSVEQTRGRIDCGTQGVAATVSPERFRGVRIFDITDVRKPRQVAAVQTCRGSHTHTLVADPDDKEHVYIYGSGTSTVRSAEELAGCSGRDPKDDPDTALFSIDVIQVPLAAPEKARIVNRPRIFADPKTGAVSGLWPGGTHGPGTQRTSVTNQCHDITVFPAMGLAAGACSGNGILLDISDPVHPVRLDDASDKNFAYWHSATFNNDGTKVIFTDEWGGGTRPRCRPTDPPTWGADAIFDIVDRKLQFGGYFKLPAPQTDQENCVAHNGSIVPVPGRDIMVQAWYQGGLSVFDFTDSAHPFEIAFFDRGPVDAKQLITAGYWSTYWFNGHIYASEIARGLDVFRLTPGEYLTRNEIEAAGQVRRDEFNAQQQPKVTWPATSAVGKAYLDQLARSNAVQPARAAAIRTALEKADRIRSATEKTAASVAEQLTTLAGELEGDRAPASARDKDRLQALAATLKGRAGALTRPS